LALKRQPGNSHSMSYERTTHHRRWFPVEIISHAVWLYHVPVSAWATLS
jgi:hypothetical protein